MPQDPFGLVYLDRKSPMHNLSFTAKLVMTLSISAISLLITDIWHLLLIHVFCQVLIFLSTGVKPREFLKPQIALIPIWIILLVSSALGFALQAGIIGISRTDIRTIDFIYFSIPYSQIGVKYAIVMYFRGLNIGLMTFGTIWTTHPRDIVYTVINVYKISYKWAWTVFLTLIFTPLVAYEARVIRHMHQIRGINVRTYIPNKQLFNRFLFPLIVRSLRRSSTTSTAMDSRAFGAYPERTFSSSPSPSRYSKYVGFIFIIFTIIYLSVFWKYINISSANPLEW